MPKRSLVTTAAMVLLATAGTAAQEDATKAEIREAIDAGYLNGYWNDMNMKALLNVWDHGAISPGIAPNGQMYFTTLINWFSGMTSRQAPAKREYRIVYPVIDVAGDMAMAKVEVMKGETIEYTDYFPLFKTRTGWKIVAYPYYPHKKGERPVTAAGEADAVSKAVEDTIVHGLIEAGNKQQVLAGVGEICDVNRYVPELDAVTKQDLGVLFAARADGLKAYPVKSQTFSLIGITGHVAAETVHAACRRS